MQTVSQIIGNKYLQWNGKKIFLRFRVGLGKTSFIVRVYYPYLRSMGMKCLILCNRRLLVWQTKFDFVRAAESYNDAFDNVTISTYHETACKIEADPEYLSQFDVVVCDEAHFFYADSTFTGGRPYIFFSRLIKKTRDKTVIFLSATPDPVCELIEGAYQEAYANSGKGAFSLLNYGDENSFDTSGITYALMPDIPTMVDHICKRGGKAIIFINNKKKAAQISDDFREHGIKSVKLLDADKLSDEDPFVREMVITNQQNAQILITTSVLDNGVSLKDPEIKSVVIMAEDKVSFVQMFGRVRSGEFCLFFVEQNAEFYRKFMEAAQHKLDLIKEMSEHYLTDTADVTGEYNCKEALLKSWMDNDSEEAQILRSFFVIYDKNEELFTEGWHGNGPRMVIGYGWLRMTLNRFAFKRLQELVFSYTRFYDYAMHGSQNVALAQLKWLGIQTDKIECFDSNWRKEEETKLRDYILTKKDYAFDLSELKTIKADIIRDFGALFPDVDLHNNSMNNDKLETILQSCGFHLESEKISGKNAYTIIEKSAPSMPSTN